MVQIRAQTAGMPGNTGICNHIDYSFLAPPLSPRAPAVYNICVPGAAVDFHVHRINLRAVEILRISDKCPHRLAVFCRYADKTRQRQAVRRGGHFELAVLPLKPGRAAVREACLDAGAVFADIHPVNIVFDRSHGRDAAVCRKAIEGAGCPGISLCGEINVARLSVAANQARAPVGTFG